MTFTTGTRRVLTSVGAASALALMMSAPAPAATTFGANLGLSPTTGGGTCPLPAATSTCAYVGQSTLGTYTAPSSGVITRWRIKGAYNPSVVVPVAPKVIREAGGFYVESISTGTAVDVNVTGITDSPTRLRVQAGDLFGIEIGLASGPTDPTLPYVFINPGPVGTWLIEPSVADGATILAATDSLQPLVNADIEPDADNDGYGDESQDACPTVASRQSAPCVTVPAPGVPATCKVPKLKGLSKSKAKAALVKAGCKLGKTSKKKSKKGKKGRATKQSPAAGKVVAAGTSVTLTLKK